MRRKNRWQIVSKWFQWTIQTERGIFHFHFRVRLVRKSASVSEPLLLCKKLGLKVKDKKLKWPDIEDLNILLFYCFRLKLVPKVKDKMTSKSDDI